MAFARSSPRHLLSLLTSLQLLALHSTTFCWAFPLVLHDGFQFSPSMTNFSLPIGCGDASATMFFPVIFNSSFPRQSTPSFRFGIWATLNAEFGVGIYDMYFGVSRLQPPLYRYLGEVASMAGKSDGPDSSISITSLVPCNALPVWTANANRPLRSVNASLVFGRDKSLKLIDFDGTVMWNASNVAAMEMLDSGNLVIYDSTNATIWQSFDHPADLLVRNQSLRVGMQLISNDARYSMAMKPGGLVFYLLSQAAAALPYWIIPASNVTTNISQAPCSAANDARATLGDDAITYFTLYPGSCIQDFEIFFEPSLQYYGSTCDFVRLQTDGRLHCYLQLPTGLQDLFTLDNPQSNGPNLTGSNYQTDPPALSWGNCDVPLACGPYSICSPAEGDSPNCVCPSSAGYDSVFTPSSEGCQLSVALPSCTVEGDLGPASNTSFMEIKNTATILLFAGATSHATNSTLDGCKQFCSNNCSCPGIIYMRSISFCFPLPINVSLLNVLSNFNYQNGTLSNFNYQNGTAQDYVAYLKTVQYAGEPPKLSPYDGKPPKKNRMPRSVMTMLVIVSVMIFVLLAGLVVYRIALQKRNNTRNSENRAMEQELLHILPCLSTRFSYRDLNKATGGFNNLLGEGGFGSVYAGVLPDGRQVAVKKLEITGLHGKQFLAEVATIGQTNHFNIVPLVGFCCEISNRLLVYECMEKGSLDRWLFNVAGDEHLLDWATRCNIAIGIAKGLSYLHDDCQNPILHLDIKPQNILLDKNFVPKLADFGLSKLMSRDISRVVTMARGTPGYIAPELCLSQAAVSKKSDVYSLGMVLLEIVGGRKNIDISLLVDGDGKADERHFPSWAARKCEKGNIADLVDARLQGEFRTDEARRMIEAALWCIQEDPSLRPSAATVSKWLDGSSHPLNQPPFATVAYSRSQFQTNVTRSLQTE